MKKSLRIFSAIMVLLVIFAGCSKNKTETADGKTKKSETSAADISEKISVKESENGTEKSSSSSEKTNAQKYTLNIKELLTDKGRRVMEHFGEKYSYKYVMENISLIDLKLKPDLDKNKYTVKNIKADENSPNTVQYYKNGTLVYETLEGFGEDCYIHHTKTKNGAAAKVYYYYDENGIIYNIVIKTDGYTAKLDGMRESENGEPRTIIITAEKKSQGKLNESVMYCVDAGNIVIEKAQYYGKGGYIEYLSWIDGSNKLHEDESVKFSELTASTDENTVNKIKKDLDISVIQTLMGCHRLSYKGDKWFITTDLYILFPNEASAKSYAEKNGINKEQVSNKYAVNDEMFYVLYKNITLPVSDRFILNQKDDFNELASAEFNDLTFADIITDDNGQVTAIDYTNAELSCY